MTGNTYSLCIFLFIFILVQQIGLSDKIWLNCAFNDKSMKFGTLLEYTFLVIFGYRAIADLTCDKIGSHFPIWPPSSLGKRGFVWENCGTCILVFSGC